MNPLKFQEFADKAKKIDDGKRKLIFAKIGSVRDAKVARMWAQTC